MRRIALQQTFALLALTIPAAALAADGPSATAVVPAVKTELKVKTVAVTGSIGTPAVARLPTPGAEEALGGDVTRTRFLIGLPKQVEFQVFSLSNPNRVIVDVAETALQLPPQPEENIAVGLVSAFRAGMSAPGKSRVVIEVTRPVVVESAKVEPTKDGKGRRLALEIVPVDAASATQKKPLKAQPFGLGAATLASVELQPPLPVPAMRPDQLEARSFKPIIVIDPGHGGHDSGAEKNGTVEKDVVLAFSLKLKEKLEGTGRYKVIMTRDTDVFVELGERVAFAERHKANLFIAVHADYADGNSSARGATIYSLRESVANALQRNAKGEKVLSQDEVETVKKASVDGDLAAVKSILADLAGREVNATQERTSMFSRSVIEYMGASTELRAKPDQQAAFRVLKTAQFPSVLIELAYVTNKQDAELLKSDAWRDKVSESIMTAVENYFSNQLARLPM
jgi:N-acetylmuramoyl-L-alanine amidase